MTDREKYLTILDRFYRGRGGSLLTKDESEALDYAISSIKTDLKYDLLYEETKYIADTDKMIGSTTKNCRSCRNFGSHHGICEICKDNKCWTEKEPIERYHSRNLKAYADEMGVSVEQAEKELLREEPTTKKDVPENNVGNIYICSCGYGWDKSKVVRYHFCPNCGKAVASATKNGLTVSKGSVLDALRCCYDTETFTDSVTGTEYIDYNQAVELVNDLPSVTPQEPRWIPISEMLPKEFETVILSTDKDEVFIGDYLGKMNDGTDCFDDNDGMYWEGNVVAWMPLPLPWKGE